MMLIDREGCYLIDTQFYFRKVQLRFPCKYIYQGRADVTHRYTLLDGELVTETLPETQVKRTIYLIYDMIAINESSVTEEILKQQIHSQSDIGQCKVYYDVAEEKRKEEYMVLDLKKNTTTGRIFRTLLDLMQHPQQHLQILNQHL